MTRRFRWGVAIVIATLYTASLALPISRWAAPSDWFGRFSGWWVLIRGADLWVSNLDWSFARNVERVAWLSHPAIWLILVFLVLNRPRSAFCASLVATTSSLLLGMLFALDVVSAVGYWCWCLSAATGLVGGLYIRPRHPIELSADYGPPDVTPQ